MPWDLAVPQDGAIPTNSFGDYERVRGQDNAKQQIRLAVTSAVDFSSITQLTQRQKRSIRRDLADALDECPYVDDIVSIQVRTPDDETVAVNVDTRSGAIPLAFDR